jgi:hypothetical protein
MAIQRPAISRYLGDPCGIGGQRLLKILTQSAQRTAAEFAEELVLG